MDFKRATDRMMEERLTLKDIAEETGMSHQALLQARLNPSTTGYRSPPKDWRAALAKLARERGEGLLELAKQLEEAEGA